jgi:hypothetical protein
MDLNQTIDLALKGNGHSGYTEAENAAIIAWLDSMNNRKEAVRAQVTQEMPDYRVVQAQDRSAVSLYAPHRVVMRDRTWGELLPGPDGEWRGQHGSPVAYQRVVAH